MIELLNGAKTFAEIVIAIVGFLLLLARAKPDELRKATSIGLKLLAVFLMVAIVVASCYQIYVFLSQSTQPTRLDIFSFALAFFNALAYLNMLGDFFIYLAGRGQRAREKDLEERLLKAHEERREAEERKILAIANTNCLERINDTLKLMMDRSDTDPRLTRHPNEGKHNEI